MNLEELYKTIEDRKRRKSKDSYVAFLFEQGQDRIIQKFGEESVEVVIAAKNKNRKEIISEVADLLFHLLILMNLFKISLLDILKELYKRGVK